MLIYQIIQSIFLTTLKMQMVKKGHMIIQSVMVQ